MTSASEVLAIARNELGYQEEKSGKSKYGVWYGVQGFETAAWCAMFVSWCFDRAKLKLPPIQNNKGFAYCPFGYRWFRDNNQMYRTAVVGDIVFFDWGGDKLSDHVGIVEEVHPTFIRTIEGNTALANQSNGGRVMRRVRYYPSCLGFARPNYEEKSIDWSGFYLQLNTPYTNSKEVGVVQCLLEDMGYDLEIDNIYGRQTEAAVRDFQDKNGLEVDGVVGPLTWEKLHQ